MGTPLNAWRQRLPYTTDARLGRLPVWPLGEYWSSDRTFFWAVSLLSMLSRLPAVIPTKSRGVPISETSEMSSQRGWLTTPTR